MRVIVVIGFPFGRILIFFFQIFAAAIIIVVVNVLNFKIVAISYKKSCKKVKNFLFFILIFFLIW